MTTLDKQICLIETSAKEVDVACDRMEQLMDAILTDRADLLDALRSVRDGYQKMIDVMPVAFQTYAHIVESTIERVESSR